MAFSLPGPGRFLLLCALFLCLSAAGQEEAPETLLDRFDRELSTLAEEVRPGVVPVVVRHRVEMETGSGIFFLEETHLSAVVCSREGILVTLLGGVEGAESIEVTLPGEKPLPAKVGARDRATGLAVLKVEGADLTPVKLAETRKIRPGQLALAVGNHHGLSETVRVGFIGSARRGVMVDGEVYGNLMQFFIQIGPGDGGGGLFGSDGRLTGIIHSRFDSKPNAARLFPFTIRIEDMDLPFSSPGGMGFAVPAKDVRLLLACQERFGEMRRGWAGVTLGGISEEERSRSGLEPGVGGKVRRVDRKAPAYRAGLRRNDILLSWDGEPVVDLNALRDRVRGMTEARAVPIAWLHRGERREGTVQVEILSE